MSLQPSFDVDYAGGPVCGKTRLTQPGCASPEVYLLSVTAGSPLIFENMRPNIIFLEPKKEKPYPRDTENNNDVYLFPWVEIF